MHEIFKHRSHKVLGLNALYNGPMLYFSNLSEAKWANDRAFQYGLLVYGIKII